MIIIKTKINFNEYLKLMYFLTYRKGWILYILIIGIILLLFSFQYFTGDQNLKDFPGIQFGIGILTTFILPISVYFSSKRNFNSSKLLAEPVVYEFSNEKMKVTGESFNSDILLSQIYKIEELRNWFLIYPSKLIFNMIPKSEMSEEQKNQLQAVFKGLNIKLRLKEN